MTEPIRGASSHHEPLKTKYHRDGSVTFWDVFTQSWTRAHNLQGHELATLTAKERRRIVRHFLAHTAPKEYAP